MDDIFMTRAGSRLLESLAKRGVNPTVTSSRSSQWVARKEQVHARTIKYAFHVQSEHAVPSTLFRKAVSEWIKVNSKTTSSGKHAN
jgi:hypothetical protein